MKKTLYSEIWKHKEMLYYSEGQYIMKLTVTYEPLFKTMKSLGVTQTNLIRKYNVSSSLFSKLKAGKNVQMSTILQLMKDIGTDNLNDILEIKVQ